MRHRQINNGKMSPVHLAVVFLSSPKGGYGLILDKGLAGLSVLKRLLLTLQKAGIKEILILHQELDGFKLNSLKNEYASDPRFKCKLHWHDKYAAPKLPSNDLTHSQPFLLTNGSVVTQENLIRVFIKNAATNLTSTHSIQSFHKTPESEGGLYLLPREKFDKLEQYVRQGKFDNDAEKAFISDSGLFWHEIDTRSSLRKAEKLLLRQCRSHHAQFMDKWFNSIFSVKLSRLLAKTPVTPNQLTLFGLVIGFAAGWFFAQGSYSDGVIGGILLAITAIWDCCDGDVARLKHMESDFGETLDTCCDNLINFFAFTGIMTGVSHSHGNNQALIPFLLLILGGGSILALIYCPRGGKGGFFRGTKMFDVIETLASRNFIYIILLFALMGRLDIFLWLAGFGSITFALALYFFRLKVKRIRSSMEA